MSNNEFNLDLIGCLQQTKSKRQINADIRQIEKAINMLRITGTLAKGDTKKEINNYIKNLGEKLNYVKLKGKIDDKNLKREIEKSLHNMSFEDIDALKVDENKTKLKLKKVIADIRAFAEKNTISVNVGMKKEKLNNDLTTFLNKNTKIRESSFLLEESERIRELINSVDDKGTLKEATEAFQLYKSEVSACGFATKSTSDKIKAMLSHITKIGSFFGLASLAVNNFRKSLSTLKGNDTILTEISKTSEMTKKQLEELGNEAFKVASRYGKLSSDYLLSVQDMSRAGYLNSNSMAELSVAAQGAGDVTAELANQYIIATDKAFKMNGSVEALTATLDGANNITNHNAVNMTELGTAMSIVGSQAASAGLEVNETTAAVATMIAVTQRSGSEMANAFKGILMNLRQVSGDVGDGENIIDAESLTKYEKACAELGVSLKEVRNGIVSLKEPMQIIKELSEEYTKLDEADARRANLLSAVGGKYRANALNSLLENYDMYSKMLDEYANGLGSMNEEAEKTANSWEGRLNALQNSIDSFFNTLTNKDAIKGGISFFDRLIQGAEALTNTIGEIPVVLTAVNTAMTAMNKDYGITQVYNKEKGKFDIQGNIFGIDITNIKNLKKHFAEAKEAIDKWNAVLVTGNADINDFGEAVVQNNAQFKEYLSTCKDAPASIEGYKNHLREAGVATDGLRLKTVLLNAGISLGIGLAMQAVTKIISLAVAAWDHFNVTVEEVQENINNLTSNIESLNTELDELNSKSNLTDAEQKRLKYLETRIGLEERLLKIEQTRLEQEQLGKPSKITDWFDEDSYVKKASLEFGEDAVKRPMSALGVLFPEINNLINLIPLMNNISAYFNGAEAVIKKGNEQYKELEYFNTKYEELVKERDAFEVGSHDWQVGDERVARMASELEAYQKQVTSGSYADLLEKYGQYTKEVETLEDILANSDYLSADEIAYSQKLLGLYSSNAEEMKELINNIAISLGDQSLWVGTDLELLDSKTDILTADEIQSNFTDEEIKVLAYLDFDRNASINTLRSLLKEEQEVADDEPIKLSNVLSNESLDKFQSSVKSAADAYNTLLTGNYSSSELLDSIQAINKAASDMGEAIDWKSISASGNPLQAIQDAIESVSKSYADSVLNGAGIDSDSKFGQMFANIVQEAYESEAALSSLNIQIDSLQSAYNNLTDIVTTYNETGYITFDQLQTLLAMEPQYIACLMDESGQLQLNQESMLALANQRLDEAEAQAVQQAITELGQLALQDEKTAVEENAAAFNSAVNDLAVYNEELANTIGEASVASSVIRDLNAAISGAESQGATDVQIGTVLDNLNTKLQLIKTTRAGLSESLGNIMGGSSSASSASSAASDFSETIDFFERRVEELKNALSLLDATMDNVAGSFGKNNLIDAKLGITEEEFKNYTDALSMYTQKANEAFSKIPADIASKVKDGAVALTDFIGDGNKDVVEAIKEYESWADKVAECKESLVELQKEIRQLELEKFNNIISDFESQFNLRDDSKNLISKQIDLLKEAGELIGESFFTARIDQSKKQLELLENEKAQLVNQMSSAISSGKIQSGTDEWLEMVNALSDVDGSILDCKKSIEEFNNELLSLHVEVFNRIQNQFSDLDSEISNIIDLFDEFEVSDDKGIWSKEAIAQLGLLSQQYELAQYRIQQYNDEIDKLNAQYLSGKYSATEYASRLASLNEEQWSAVKVSESALSSLMDLNEARVENAVKGIEKEIDTYKELIDAQINSLKASKDLHDYEKSIAEKTKAVADLEYQIEIMRGDTSAATVAKRKKLEQQLSEAKADLEETQYQHSIEVQEDALNAQYESYERERNDEINKLRESLNDRETIIANSFETVKDNASLVGQEIATIATQHGITVSNSLISSWQSGENAIASYGEVLSQNTSVFIGNIMDVENEVWNLQAQANTTADSLAWMFSKSADNLVNELNTSYFAETNLANMTNALQQSLVNTLERGYDVSSIVNSLDSVAEAARRAKKEFDGLNNSNIPPEDTSDIQSLMTDAQGLLTNDIGKNVGKNLNDLKQQNQYRLIDNMTGRIYKDNLTYNEALELQKDKNVARHTKIEKYASGTRNAEDGLRIVNEEGSELVLPKLSSGDYAIGNAGDQILTKAETDNIFEWAKYDPKDFTPVSMGELVESLRERSGNGRSLAEPMDFSALTKPSAHVIQEMFKNVGIPGSVVDNSVNNNSVNNYYDSMFAFNGDVIDADRAIKQMEKVAIKIADQQIDKNWRDFSNQLRYGGSAALMRHR